MRFLDEEHEPYVEVFRSGSPSEPTQNLSVKGAQEASKRQDALARQRLLKEMGKFESIPYDFGSKKGGLDCSSSISVLSKRLGVPLPPGSWNQQNDKRGVEVSWDELRPGDLLYFYSKNSGSKRHTGVYIGNGQMASFLGSGTSGFTIENLGDRRKKNFLGAKRFPFKYGTGDGKPPAGNHSAPKAKTPMTPKPTGDDRLPMIQTSWYA